MIKINLVPQEILDREVQRQRAIQIGVAGAFVAVILAAVSFAHYQKKAGLAELLKDREGTLKTYEVIVKQVNEFESRAKAVRARLSVMTDLIQSRDLYPVFMTDLIESFPDGVWIGPLSTSGDAKVGLSIKMPAFAASTRDVTNWLRAIESSSLFGNAKIGGIAITPEGQHNFSMEMLYTPAVKDKKVEAR